MKKIIFSATCLASFGVFFFSSNTPKQATDLSLQNIEVIGLSASEMYCDGQNDRDCSINDNGVIGKGKGNLVYCN